MILYVQEVQEVQKEEKVINPQVAIDQLIEGITVDGDDVEYNVQDQKTKINIRTIE